MVILEHGVNDHFNGTKELTAMVPFRNTTKGSDMLRVIMLTRNSLLFNLNNISGGPTDRAPFMCRSQQGSTNLLQNEASKTGNCSIMHFHCLIH